MKFRFLFSLVLMAGLLACGPNAKEEKSGEALDQASHDKLLKSFQEKLILANPGDVIELPAGRFNLTKSLSLDAIDNITIKGAGKDKTVLSFLNQTQGAEGIRVTNLKHFKLSDLTIEDSKGDALKIQDCEGVLLKNVKTTWTEGAKETNGSYGIYPVKCKNVIIDGCESSFASDAGIYVGQTHNVHMKNCLVHHNVAGFEIENCSYVDAYNNEAHDNTMGFLVYDLSGLPVANGRFIRAFDNNIHDNNFQNFAPKGGIVHMVPPGTGFMIVAAKEVEVFNNQIKNHKTIGLGIGSFYMTQRPFDENSDFVPYSSNVHVHDNQIVRKDAMPDLTREWGQLINVLFKATPQDILVDGWMHPDFATDPESHRICIHDNGVEITFANLNAQKAESIRAMAKYVDADMSKFDCTMPPQEANAEPEI